VGLRYAKREAIDRLRSAVMRNEKNAGEHNPNGIMPLKSNRPGPISAARNSSV
jgi:hypothetical protein